MPYRSGKPDTVRARLLSGRRRRGRYAEFNLLIEGLLTKQEPYKVLCRETKDKIKINYCIKGKMQRLNLVRGLRGFIQAEGGGCAGESK